MRDKLIEDLKAFRTPICEGLNAKIPYAEELADYLLENGVIKKLIEQYKRLTDDNKWSANRIIETDKMVWKLNAENERLSKYTITFQTPSGEQTMPNLLSLDGDAATLYKKIEDKIKADAVREMQERLDKHFCHDLAFLGVEQRLIMDIIDQIAKEMVEGEG